MAASVDDDERGVSWFEVLLNDVELWTQIHVPAHLTDDQFIRLIEKVSECVEDLDCTDCYQLTQDAFLRLAQSSLVLRRLRRLTLPSDVTLPNAIYEALAAAGCFPALEQLENIQPSSTVCVPLRCQAYFKQSSMRVLDDCPVSSYGRARRLIVADSADHRQRRQKWEADLAKAAISCSHVDTYRCNRGLGFFDDKAFERLSVLFPKLCVLSLRQCCVTDEGLTKFFAHNRARCGEDLHGGLVELMLDRPGDVTDRGLSTVSEHCPRLTRLSICRCPALTDNGIRYLVSRCRHLTELELCCDVSEAGTLTTRQNDVSTASIDNETLAALGEHCTQLTRLKLSNATGFDSTGLDDLLSRCTQLDSLSLHSCARVDSASLKCVAERCARLNHFSLAGHMETDIATGLTDVLLRCHLLTTLAVDCCPQSQPIEVSQLAEETFNSLSNDVTCRASRLQSLMLANVGGSFVKLVTTVCSRLSSLDIRHLQKSEVDSTDVLVHVLDVCRQLKTLDVSSLDDVTDEFLLKLCEQGLELRHLSVCAAPRVSVNLLSAVISVAPSLTQLTVTVRATDSSTRDELSPAEQLLQELLAVAKSSHGRTCYCRLFTSQPSAVSYQQIELQFIPLKYMTCLSLFDQLLL